MASKQPEEKTMHEKDLPLMSNISDIHIFHYILQLKCLMEKNEMVGSVTLFRCNEWINCLRCPRNKILGTWKIDETDDTNKSVLEHNYSQNYSNMMEIIPKDHKPATTDQEGVNTSNDILPDPDFKMILDCNDIEIETVEELKVPVNVWRDINTYENFNRFKTSSESVKPLKWTCDRHSISIWKEGVKFSSDFPEVVRIQYRTKSTGQSLKWTIDRDRRTCVFTHGHLINNRSLFPSQDVPTAMATWQAEIEVKDHLTVVMGSDNLEITSDGDETGWKKEYFNTKMEMPSSTLSVAIGYWESKEILLSTSSISQKNAHIYVHPNSLMKICRLIGPASLVTQTYIELDRYIPHCVVEVSKCLGPHPFSRLDILVVPPCFDSLGMACPSVMFIAQSLLAGDYSMCVRIAHEMCHSWFGLSIGPKDWTEEWLTEGFCSYMEDIIHLNVLQELKLCHLSEAVEERQLRNYLKYKTLQNELSTTNSDLQMLRPSKEIAMDTKTSYVKDGMNPDKRFLQVHYLKGHFLLCYLEKFVGKDKFLSALHAYAIRFHKELVSSKDVITFLFNALPELRVHGLSEDKICEDWLDKSGMPETLKDYSIPEENAQIKFVKKQVDAIRLLYPKKGCRKRKKSTCTSVKLDALSSLQVVLFLEELLEDEKIPLHLLTDINNKYKPRDQNADVQHRWCELVIKHKHKKFYNDLKYFLLNHQAMGVYLYGEMVLSGCIQQKKMAELCFNSLKTHMEPDPYAIVKSMIYGT